MNLIIAGVFLFALSIVVLSFIDLKLAVAVYISYMILVPYLEFRIAGFPLSYNIVNALLIINFLYYYVFQQKRKLIFLYTSPFLFFFGALLLLSFFAFTTPFEKQFFSWRSTFMRTYVLVFIISNLFSSDLKLFGYIKWSLMISFLIAGIYGILLMNLGGINPYVNFLSSYFGFEDGGEFFAKVDSRLSFSSAAKIQSTMGHPMMWALNISFMIIILISFFLKEKRNWYLIIVSLLAFNVLISGVRTSIVALTIGMFYFLIMNGKIKYLIFASIVMIVSYFVIISNPDLSNVFVSMIDVKGNKSDISGSSIPARFEQLKGSLEEVKGKELVGNGYFWHGYYLREHGRHPVIYSFESILFIAICNHGFLGVFVYALFFFLLLYVQRKILKFKENILLVDSLVIFYFVYATGTGDYGYLGFFAIYYIFIIQYFKLHELTIQKSQDKIITPNYNRRYIKFELNGR